MAEATLPQGYRYHAFISYALEDAALGGDMARHLELRGLQVFVDDLDIGFEASIPSAAAATAFVFIWTADAVRSTTVQDALRFAAKHGRFILIVIVGDVPPPPAWRCLRLRSDTPAERVRIADDLRRGVVAACEATTLSLQVATRVEVGVERHDTPATLQTPFPPAAKPDWRDDALSMHWPTPPGSSPTASMDASPTPMDDTLATMRTSFPTPLPSPMPTACPSPLPRASKPLDDTAVTMRRPTASPTPLQVAVNAPSQLGASWQIVRAYLYPQNQEQSVEADAQTLKRQAGGQHITDTTQSFSVRRGTRITVMCRVSDAECRPVQQSFTWRDTWEKRDFEVRCAEGSEERLHEGFLSWFAGPLCIAQIPLTFQMSDGALRPQFTTSRLAEAVFVSYSTKDSVIVDWLEATYNALGLEYLRDVEVLKSGEEWSPKLLTKIEEADLFQLCWSRNAQKSPEVEKEWRAAMALQRPQFIRPCYWQRRMPAAPEELQKLHFARLKVGLGRRAWSGLRGMFAFR